MQGVSVPSTPANATSGYAAGETIRVRLDFVEAVSVVGTPYLVLNIAGAARRATYASGSGTRYLNFEYTVQAGDFDSDGISLCSNTSLDPGCGRITLNRGSISAQSDGLAAELDLPEFGRQSDHKVEGTPDDFTPNPGVGPMANPGAGEVALNWALTPPGLVRPGSFRLLFATSSRDATSAAIADYNNHAINDAGAGHSAIRAFKNGFRVIASTEAVDARDNAGLTGTGVKIYWMGSNDRVADDYADLLDGSWDNESATDKNGSASSARFFWTGSGDDGTEGTVGTNSLALGTDDGPLAAFGALNATRNPLRAGSSSQSTLSHLYGLSQVLKLPPQATRQHDPHGGLEPTSRPRQGDTYRLGETFIFPFVFTEPVVVRGVPTMPLKLDSGTVRARYVSESGTNSGSGTDRLLFAYTVQTGDYDEDGPVASFRAGDSYMALDGASVRALADGSPALLVADAAWLFPFNVFGFPHRIEGRPAFATGASISSSPASGSTYGAGETVTVSLAMNEAVRVTGRPHVLLDVGGARRRADYAGPIGEATDALEFSYTVQSGDFDADGVALCASGPGCGSIQLDGGSIRAAAGDVDANLRLPELAAQAGHRVDAAAPLPAAPTACSAEVDVRSDWALKPSGVAAGGKFRLLFITSNARRATSSNIADYNRFVQDRAAAGHSAVRDYSAGFRAVGSTASVDARDNTCSTGTGVRIHWLNGSKVADNYGDFYDDTWDDETNRRHENGATNLYPIGVWTGSGADGTGAEGDELGQVTVMKATFQRLNGGALSGPLQSSAVNASLNTNHLYGLSQVFVVKAGSTTPATTDISIISSPAIGDTYRLGETIEVEVTYSEAVTVRGTPSVGLSVKNAAGTDDIEYDAAYVRGSGTTKLVFAFTVPSGLKDDDGIQLHSDPLRLNGGTITAVSDGIAAVWNLDAEKNLGGKVDSSLVLSGGICDRMPAVRNAIVAAVRGNDSNVGNCSQVTEAHLAALTGTLEVGGLTSIGAGDFAGLSGVETLGVGGSGIETLPVGLFDGLDSLTFLSVVTGLTHLPKDIFRGLGKLTTLYLWRNDIGAGGLPDGIFEPLTGLTDLKLSQNPGAASFSPAADAGPGGTLSAGQTVTLGGPGTSGGPWGSNVTHAWTQTDGDDRAASTVTLSAADAAKPGFTVPALSAAAGVKLVLTVRGRGGAVIRHTATSEAEFTIRALAPTAVAVVSKPVDGGGHLQTGTRRSRSR